MALTEVDIEHITKLIRDENAALKAEIDRVDNWANGVYKALSDLTTVCLQDNSKAAALLAEWWKDVADDYDRVEAGQQIEDPQPLEFLEARKMLYRKLKIAKIFQPH
jgi:hypothetical protein